ncbi:glycine cleavage system protein GcvH [Isoptericola sp. b441]|uniref:Glycine cleavage system H protein n=1 Tax=Actinotalea lenta TaxID=3064654 RepID=A0ABT9D5L4_9CELL|nr:MULTISPECIES: glycine cleavage system protein GcvH [unclassified Isoptericola]MDO8106083.1 glycine cleavage system protein GcvH [Isoptericola sp. b441]MDO8122198.1 glycine cleavage system protein GcvH [Isoptericola sp. b490]
MSNPTELQYTAEHEWVAAGDPATVGITAHAADALGDVVYLELPEVGATITAGEVCGEIESTKSVSELFAPVDGTVVEVNSAAVDDPSVVNADPYGAGWLLRVAVSGDGGELLTAEQYAALVGE